MWNRFSESGSHTNLESIVSRFHFVQTATGFEYRLNYTGVKPEVLLPALFEMLLVFFEMEKVLFKDYRDRLRLDDQLVDLRTKFENDKEAFRESIKRMMGIS
jgi:hypothetical protein